MSSCHGIWNSVCINLMLISNFKIPPSFYSVALQVIVPLLVTEDERTLVTCINCLTKVKSMRKDLSALQYFT